jgi:hypothetical protein
MTHYGSVFRSDPAVLGVPDVMLDRIAITVGRRAPRKLARLLVNCAASVPSDMFADIAHRQRELETAQKHADDSREMLYSTAERHAYLLAGLEKLVVTMKDEAMRMEAGRDDTEA